MKKLTIPILSLLLLPFFLEAQVDIGVKFGLHSFELSSPNDIILPGNNGTLEFTDAKLGFQGGFYSKFEFGGISLEPRVMLHSTKVNYTLNGEGNGIVNSIREETFTNLDIPVMLGFDVLFLEAKIGPVAHLHLNSASDLFDIDGYDDRFDTATYGFRAGIGIDWGDINFGLEYEGNFSKFGEHITIGDTKFSFDETPSRIVFNVGIAIL